MWSLWLAVSAGCLAAAVALWMWVRTRNLCKNPFAVLFGGVFLSVTLMFLPLHGAVTFHNILVSIFHTMQVFTVGCDFEVVSDAGFVLAYEVWAAALYIVAPFFTFGFILSFFKNITAYCRLAIESLFVKELYVFSELNGKALQLASSLREQHKKALFVFTDVFEDNSETVFEQIDSARKLGAICFKKDMAAIRFNKLFTIDKLTLLAIGENETENLNQALRLIEMYKQRENTHVFVFSTKLESELLLAQADKGKVKVRRVNEVRSLINYILYKQGHLLFDNAVPLADGSKGISAAVIGMGRHGTEMVKALAWYGQMDGYQLEVHAFDRDPLAEEIFVASAPELMSAQRNGTKDEGEAQYTITVHSGVDVRTASFAELFKSIGNVTYVLVALGRDDININVAAMLRMYCERMKIHPVIQAIVYDPQQKQALDGVKNFKGQPYDIQFIGDRAITYTEEVIMDSELEREALNRHLKWGEEDEFWTYEYNYRSSVASAIHRLARIHCGIAGAAKAESELTEEERYTIEVLEHRRWNAYMRAEGYVYSGSRDKSGRNDLGKMHHDLVDFESLSEEDKRKDSRVGTE